MDTLVAIYIYTPTRRRCVSASLNLTLEPPERGQAVPHTAFAPPSRDMGTTRGTMAGRNTTVELVELVELLGHFRWIYKDLLEFIYIYIQCIYIYIYKGYIYTLYLAAIGVKEGVYHHINVKQSDEKMEFIISIDQVLACRIASRRKILSLGAEWFIVGHGPSAHVGS